MITTSSSNKLKLSRFPFQTLNSENLLDTLGPNSSWVLPQTTALLARIIQPQKVDNKFSFRATSDHLRARQDDLSFDCGTPITIDHLRGIFLLVKSCPRGSSLGSMKQISDGIRYAANVPLALAALKQYRNINYSEWDWTDPARKLFLDKDMVEMSEVFGMRNAFSDEILHWDNETLIGYRANSRLVKTGKTAGTIRPMNSTVSITKTGDASFDNLPKFAKLALCQTWIFQPSLYHNLMISNLSDLDSPPLPLVDTEVIVAEPRAKKTAVSTDYYEDNLF